MVGSTLYGSHFVVALLPCQNSKGVCRITKVGDPSLSVIHDGMNCSSLNLQCYFRISNRVQQEKWKYIELDYFVFLTSCEYVHSIYSWNWTQPSMNSTAIITIATQLSILFLLPCRKNTFKWPWCSCISLIPLVKWKRVQVDKYFASNSRRIPCFFAMKIS